MIITENRDFKKIKKDLEQHKTVIIMGCGRCATSCSTGGAQQVEEMREKLIRLEKQIIYSTVIEVPCDERLVKQELRKITFSPGDCILTMCCGSGTSAIGDLSPVPVYPALDTLFLGVIQRFGIYDERCSLCGECILNETGGICPITRCAKGLLNGPCGGAKNELCEINTDRKCAWILIYNNLKNYDKLKNMTKYWPAKSYHFTVKPQTLNKLIGREKIEPERQAKEK